MIQINIEYNVSYVYHAMYSYFARDNVALPGIAEYFKNESSEERSHAEKLMDFQVLRGGKVALQVRYMIFLRNRFICCYVCIHLNNLCRELFSF